MSASSSTLPFQFSVGAEDVIMRDEPVQTSLSTLEVASPVPSKGKRTITEEHWKWLQPIVSRLYIEKKLTFIQIQTKLRSDYDFYLSRRTFTKKIDKWGLKKNIRRKERNELLKLGQNHEKFKGDHRLRDEARLKRLRKRYDGDSSLLGQCNSSHSNDMDINEVEGTTTTIQSQQLHQNDALPNTANVDDETQFDNDDDVEEIMPQCSEINSSASNQWWAEPTTVSVDKLVVSFAALGIQVSPELLKRGVNPAKDEDSDSDTEQQQPLGASCARASGTESYSTQTYWVQVGRSSRNVPNKRTRNPTFNPYAEMSVFPARPKKASHMTWDIFVVKRKREWPMEKKRLESKLRSPTPCNKERISTLDRLISLQNKMHLDSSCTCTALLRALKSEPERDRSRISKAYFNLIKEHLKYFGLQEAQKVFREYRNEFNENPKFTNPELLYLQAHHLYNLGQYHKAENFLRPLICFALTQFGLFNYFTMQLFDLYNLIIAQRPQGKFVEGENILRLSLSVYSGEEADFNFYLWSNNAFSLLQYFINNGRYEEAQSLCSYLMKRTQSTFGNESQLYIECQIRQARIWHKQGKLEEALDLSYQLSNNPKVNSVTKSNLFSEIFFILWQKGDFSEAAIWARKTVEARIILYGLQHPYVLIDCDSLGLCYEKLGQWGAALRLYSSFLGRLRKCRGVEESSVKKVERWISYVERQMERIAQESESEMEVENERERDENAKEGAGIEGVEDMGSGQGQTTDDVEDIDWDKLHDMPTPLLYVV